MGAISDESTWVLTSYLVSNAIILPISGWLVSLLGRKQFFIICLVLFTLSSLLCGIAPTLPILLIARVIQGAGGGGLQPMAQAILPDTFPPENRGLAFSIYGVTAVYRARESSFFRRKGEDSRSRYTAVTPYIENASPRYTA